MTSIPPVSPPPYAPAGWFDRLVAIETLTPKFLRDNYLVGLKFVDEAGKPYPEEWYQQKIAVAISHFEHHTQLTVTPRIVESELHDYHIRDYENYCFLQLYHYPLVATTETPKVAAVYPTGQVITHFPREWCRVDAFRGQLQLVPTQGTLSQVILGQGGSYLPIIYQGLGYLPQLFRVDYTAGFDKGMLPHIFLDAITKLACIELLTTISDSVLPAGITSQSLGVDGLSESRGFMNNGNMAPVFTGRLSQYKRELFGDTSINYPGLFNDIKSFYRGVNMWVTI